MYAYTIDNLYKIFDYTVLMLPLLHDLFIDNLKVCCGRMLTHT